MQKSFLAVVLTAAMLLAPCSTAAESAETQEGPLEINWTYDVPSGQSAAENPDSADQGTEEELSGETASDGTDASSEAASTEGGTDDHFVTFGDIGLRMYLVPGFTPADLSEDDREMGYVALFENEDQSAAVGVLLINADGADLKSYKETLHQLGSVSDITEVVVNGRSGVRYRIEGEGALYVGFPTQNGYTIEFSFASDADDFSDEAELMLSSIMPAA